MYKISIMNSRIMLIIAILALAVGTIYFFSSRDTRPIDMEALREAYSEYAEQIDEIERFETGDFTSDDPVTVILGHGLAWKSLADRTQEQDHYDRAIALYEEGLMLTSRENSVLLMNIGNIYKDLEDYEKAEELFQEALALSPGDIKIYIALARLYEYRLGNDQDQIVALLDTGIETALHGAELAKYKASYLARQSQ